MFKILINHLGYSVNDTKKVVIQSDIKDIQINSFKVLDENNGEVYSGNLQYSGRVASWHTGYYLVGRFDDLKIEGKYRINVGGVLSAEFEISSHLTTMRLLNATTYYFKAQRDSGEWAYDDKALPFEGEREGLVDGHGAWYDATGDYGIHLSHLSHSTYYNPQQASFSAYAFFKVADILEESGNESYTMLKRRLYDEGFWGLDFLMRMRAPSGSFFRSISREAALDSVVGTRRIGFEYHGSSNQFCDKAATADDEIINDTNYETSMRSGGGTAIAALAIGARHYYPARDYEQSDYILSAKASYKYLRDNNEKYTNDGKWNLVDIYCALLAATELYVTTNEYEYLRDCREYVSYLTDSAKVILPGMRRLEFSSDLPYFSASDEGLPLIAMLQYSQIEIDKERAESAKSVAFDIMRWKIHLNKGICNPFDYPVFEDYSEGKFNVKFFFPHKTTAAPWWQGDNARIASISAAAKMVAQMTDDVVLAKDALTLSHDILDWILGQNPYDACMLEGYGRNNIQYFFKNRYDFINCPGGIVNGITSGLEDENDIEFVVKPDDRIDDNWRWAEQWIPHATWFLYAMALKRE